MLYSKKQTCFTCRRFKKFYVNLTDVGGDGQPERAWHFDAGHHGRISILSRGTGFEYRDIETGYRDTWSMVARGCDNYGKNFWLASGHLDIRDRILYNDGEMSWDDAVAWIKEHANTCIGVEDVE